MKAHTQEYKQNLITLGKEIDAKVKYTINGVETELDGDTLGSVTPHFEGNILKSTMKQVDIVSDVDIPLNTEINVKLGIKYDDGEYEYLDYGNYIVFSSDKQEDMDNYKIIAYDKMLYSMKDYEELEITYPITIRDYINAICTQIGLTFANSNDTFANYDKTIKSDLYKDLGYTYRDILDELAQATASTICINDDDELEVRYLSDSVNATQEVEGKSLTITNAEDFKIINPQVEGEITQETTQTGKNKFNTDLITTTGIVEKATTGFKITYNNSRFGPVWGVNLPASNYRLISTLTKSSSSADLRMQVDYTDSTHSYYQITSGNQAFGNSSKAIQSIQFYFQSGTPNNEWAQLDNLMILLASESDLTYEPYIPNSPSPDYPQPINIVTGLQEINIGGANLLNFNNSIYGGGSNVNYEIVNSNEMKFTCVVEGDYLYKRFSLGNDIKKYLGKTLYLKYNATNPNTKVYLRLFDGAFNGIGSLQANSITIPSDTNAVYVGLQIYPFYEGNPSVGDEATISDVMVSYSDMEFKPYISEKKEINLGRVLPSGYTQVEYIEKEVDTSNKRSTYINTNLLPSRVAKIEADITWTKTLNDYNFFMGGYFSTATTGIKYFCPLLISNTGYIGYGYGGSWVQSTTKWGVGERHKVVSIIKPGVQALYIDEKNIAYGGSTQERPNANVPMSILAYNYQERFLGDYGWGGKIYSLKIYDDNDKLLRDYVPCYRNSDNVIGLYDMITNTFTTKEAGADFLKGGNVSNGIELGKISTYQDKIFRNTNLFNFRQTPTIQSDEVELKDNGVYIDFQGEEEGVGIQYTLNLTPNKPYRLICDLVKEDVSAPYLFLSRTGHNYYINDYGENAHVDITFTPTTNETTLSLFLNEEVGTHAKGSVKNIYIGEGEEFIPYGEYGDWYLHKEIGKVVLDGSESWEDRPNYNDCDRFVIPIGVPLQKTGVFNGYSNYFRVSTTSSLETTYPYIRPNNGQIVVNYSAKGITTLADFKTWLGTHNTILYYILANPTNTKITNDNYPELLSQLNSLKNAPTFEGQTNITSTFPIKFSYVTDYETIDEDYIKNTRADFGEKYGPINSIVLSRSADTDNIYLQDEDSIEENGLCEIKIKDNQIMNDNDRSDFLPDLLNALEGIEYYVNDFESIGITYLELCDKYRIKIGDTKYNCVMFNDEVEFGDGLNEIIYTEKPKEEVTDYKMASKTDKAERQTYLIVDKQSQRIDAVVSVQEEDHSTLSQLTIDVDGIRTKVELNYDFVRETSGDNYISVDDMQQEGLVELKIIGTAINNGYLRLHITNNVPEYIDLPITNIIYGEEEDYDTLSIESVYNEETQLYELHCFVIKRLTMLNGQVATNSNSRNLLTDEETYSITTEDGQDLKLETFVSGKEDLGVIDLPIQSGQHTFSIVGFNDLNYYLKYATINNVSNEFALRKHIVSEINQSAEQIQISADKVSLNGKTIELTSDDIEINSDNFKVDSEGNMSCNNANIQGTINSNNGEIGGWIINGDGLTNSAVHINSDGSSTIYTVADLVIMRNYIMGVQGFDLSTSMKKHYDLNNDGVVDASDYVMLQNLIGISMND